MPSATIFSILTGGGFTFETNTLLSSLADDHRFILLITEFAGAPPRDADVLHLRQVPSFGSFMRPSRLQSAKAFLVTFFVALSLLLRHRVDVVVTIGTSHSVPLLLAARLMLRRSVFIESVTRVANLSKTGDLVYRFRLASVFLVQWPSLLPAHPRARLGTIL